MSRIALYSIVWQLYSPWQIPVADTGNGSLSVTFHHMIQRAEPGAPWQDFMFLAGSNSATARGSLWKPGVSQGETDSFSRWNQLSIPLKLTAHAVFFLRYFFFPSCCCLVFLRSPVTIDMIVACICGVFSSMCRTAETFSISFTQPLQIVNWADKFLYL